jgi:hypothetical protein
MCPIRVTVPTRFPVAATYVLITLNGGYLTGVVLAARRAPIGGTMLMRASWASGHRESADDLLSLGFPMDLLSPLGRPAGDHPAAERRRAPAPPTSRRSAAPASS